MDHNTHATTIVNEYTDSDAFDYGRYPIMSTEAVYNNPQGLYQLVTFALQLDESWGGSYKERRGGDNLHSLNCSDSEQYLGKY